MGDCPTTVGELRQRGYGHRTVRDELRANLVRKLRAGERLFPGLHGYDDTVVPQVANAILAGHDILLLGERGQAKSRLARSLTGLLDEWMPMLAGSETNDDPMNPISAYGRALIEQHGDDAPVTWKHREHRFAEKLATPDTAIADLIGEVDPIKITEGRYLSNEEIISFGLIPRTNRGIFNLNELPDLSERIQVGLLNVLEERDVQIRGFTVRIPLDIVIVASANPEDYTNRGRIITPLKDRFGSQVRTHYPTNVAQELDIVRQERAEVSIDDLDVVVPWFIADFVAEVSRVARTHAQISPRSGVSVRMTISNYEALVANAQRRAIVAGDNIAVPGVVDFPAMMPATLGKLEFDTWEANGDARVVDDILATAVRNVGAAFTDADWLIALEQHINGGAIARLDGTQAACQALTNLRVPADAQAGAASFAESNAPSVVLATIGFALEFLYRSGRVTRVPDGYAGLA